VDLTTLDSLGLKVGYLFAFGDDWWHQVNVEAAARRQTPTVSAPDCVEARAG